MSSELIATYSVFDMGHTLIEISTPIPRDLVELGASSASLTCLIVQVKVISF